MKRKFLDRNDWKRIQKRKYRQQYFCDAEFKGYAAILYTLKVKKPLIKNMLGKDYCIVNDGYIWLQHIPDDKNYAVTTMYNSKYEIVQ